MCTYILTAGYTTEPFDDRQVDRFLQQMEARVAQMRQAIDEKKVGSQVQSIVTTKTIPPCLWGALCVLVHVVYICTCLFCKWPSVQPPLPPPPPPTAPGCLFTPYSQPSIQDMLVLSL